MIKEAFAKALVPVTNNLRLICALAPLYVTMSLVTRQMQDN